MIARVMDDEAAFIATIASNPTDWLTPLVYADWLEERGDPRARLLRVWTSLTQSVSHASREFRELQDEYRRLWAAADPAWLRAVGTARPWVNAELAEELARGYFRYIVRRPPRLRGVISGQTTRFEEPFAYGWLVPYWLGDWHTDARGRSRESRWILFVQVDLGWVYTIPTSGFTFLQRYDTASGEGHSF